MQVMRIAAFYQHPGHHSGLQILPIPDVNQAVNFRCIRVASCDCAIGMHLVHQDFLHRACFVFQSLPAYLRLDFHESPFTLFL